MDSTLGMLGVSGPAKPPPKSSTASNGTSTLPKSWQPGGQQKPRRSNSSSGPDSRPPAGQWSSPPGPGQRSSQGPRYNQGPDPRSPGPRSPGPPTVGFQNGYNKPRSSLSSYNDSVSSPVSQRSGVSWAPSSPVQSPGGPRSAPGGPRSPRSPGGPRSPSSPNASMNLMQQKFGTWAPSGPTSKSPQRTSPPSSVPYGRGTHITRTHAPQSFSVPPPAHQQQTHQKPHLGPYNNKLPDKKTKKEQKPSKLSPGSYQQLQKVSGSSLSRICRSSSLCQGSMCEAGWKGETKRCIFYLFATQNLPIL